MSVFDDVLRLRRRECEERRHYVAELEGLAERLRADAGRLESDIAEAAAKQADGADDSATCRGLIARHCRLQRSIAEIHGRIAAARAALAAAEQLLNHRDPRPTNRRRTPRHR